MQIKFRLTEEYRQAQFVETGDMPAQQFVMELEPSELTRENRQVLIDLGFPIPSDKPIDMTTLQVRDRSGVTGGPSFQLDAVEDADILIQRYAQALGMHKAKLLEQANAELQANIDKVDTELYLQRNYRVDIPRHASEELKQQAREINEALSDQLRKRREETQRQSEENSAIAQAAREQVKRDKQEWIAEHGSSFLKTAFEAEYDCQRRYVTERAAKDYPGYILDFDDNAEWNDRACPTEDALHDALEDNARVIWLTKPPYDAGYDPDDYDYDEEPWEAREALVIENYLGYHSWHPTTHDGRGYWRLEGYRLIKEL